MPAGAVRRSAFGALRLLAWRQVGTTSPAFDPKLTLGDRSLNLVVDEGKPRWRNFQRA